MFTSFDKKYTQIKADQFLFDLRHERGEAITALGVWGNSSNHKRANIKLESGKVLGPGKFLNDNYGEMTFYSANPDGTVNYNDMLYDLDTYPNYDPIIAIEVL